MKDLKNILKTAVDKIKSTVEKEDIPLKDAFEEMDRELEEAEAAYGKPLFPDDGEKISIDEHYMKLLGFKSEENVDFDEIKTHYETLMKKFAPENFTDDEKKKAAAEKRISMIKQAYQYFENKHATQQEEEEN